VVGIDAWQLLFHTANLLCYEVGPKPDLGGAGMKAIRRIVLMATASMMLLATTPAMAVDCAAIRAACVDRCQTVFGNAQQSRTTAEQKNCANRCSISSCQQTPLAARTCDATAQSICNNSFTSCTDACITSTATTQAILQAQASCTTSCCTKLKLCLGQRQCEIGSITAITCEEGTSALGQ
jgi:hypothetical protein